LPVVCVFSSYLYFPKTLASFIAYADDVVLVSRTKEQLLANFEILQQVLADRFLSINM
jgi:hypothetical protein